MENDLSVLLLRAYALGVGYTWDRVAGKVVFTITMEDFERLITSAERLADIEYVLGQPANADLGD